MYAKTHNRKTPRKIFLYSLYLLFAHGISCFIFFARNMKRSVQHHVWPQKLCIPVISIVLLYSTSKYYYFFSNIAKPRRYRWALIGDNDACKRRSLSILLRLDETRIVGLLISSPFLFTKTLFLPPADPMRILYDVVLSIPAECLVKHAFHSLGERLILFLPFALQQSQQPAACLILFSFFFCFRPPYS